MEENKVIVLHKGLDLEELAAMQVCCKGPQAPLKTTEEEAR